MAALHDVCMADHSHTLQISVSSGHLTVSLDGKLVRLRETWAVLYAVLALHNGQGMTIADIHDYHPWSALKQGSVISSIWRFTEQREGQLFGRRITGSPNGHITKTIQLTGMQVSLEPDRASVADHLRSLRTHRTSHIEDLNELSLMQQNGQVLEALIGVQALLKTDLRVNDRAYAQAIATTCLERLHGSSQVAQQLPLLQILLQEPKLTLVNQARLLTRVARYYTLTGQYEQAKPLYHRLRRLLKPEHGLEYCQYELNYGLYLRRTREIKAAIRHTQNAHEVAHEQQWWYGVQAARSNLALMHISLGEQASGKARIKHYQDAKHWALKGHATNSATPQGSDMALNAVVMGHILRNLGQYPQVREWLKVAEAQAQATPNLSELRMTYLEYANLEQTLVNTTQNGKPPGNHHRHHRPTVKRTENADQQLRATSRKS